MCSLFVFTSSSLIHLKSSENNSTMLSPSFLQGMEEITFSQFVIHVDPNISRMEKEAIPSYSYPMDFLKVAPSPFILPCLPNPPSSQHDQVLFFMLTSLHVPISQTIPRMKFGTIHLFSHLPLQSTIVQFSHLTNKHFNTTKASISSIPS